MSKHKKLKTNFQDKIKQKETPLLPSSSSLPLIRTQKKAVSPKVVIKQQLTKKSPKSTQAKLKTGPVVAVGSKIQNLPKNEHVSVFGPHATKTTLGSKVSRSSMLPKSKQAAPCSSLPTAVGTQNDAFKFTARSSVLVPPLKEESLVSGEFGHPLPRPSRIDLIRRLFYYLVQLLAIHFFLVLLCCYISAFTQWGKMMIVIGSTWMLSSLAALFGLLLPVRVWLGHTFSILPVHL